MVRGGLLRPIHFVTANVVAHKMLVGLPGSGPTELAGSVRLIKVSAHVKLQRWRNEVRSNAGTVRTQLGSHCHHF